MSCHEFASLAACLIALAEMQVHLIAIKISVIGITVRIVHADGLLLRKNTGYVGHDGWLMEGWLSVHKQHIPICHVTIDCLAADC
jgi:uncharacterized membrane protein